jgi:phage gpG-like protein
MSGAIEVQSEAVTAAFNALGARVGDMSPVLMALGDDIIERTKQRFATATGPDGTPWLPNTQATLIAYLNKRSGNFAAFSHIKTGKEGQSRVGDKKGYFKKDGSLTKKSQQLVANKRPLQGESGDLERQFSSLVVSGNTLLVGSSMIYAAMQQFGGTKSQFPNLWGDIPARPFLPITPDGGLYPDEENLIVDGLCRYIQG